jgi:zinc D-Ala-D-Ala carboxypeptidase
MKIPPLPLALSTLILLLVAALGFGGYQYYQLSGDYQNTRTELLMTTADYQSLQTTTEELKVVLEAEQKKNGTFESQIRAISGTVGSLDKLAKTDPELLQKYSRVFFLNEHYAPPTLVPIDAFYRYPEDKALQIHAQVAPHLTNLFKAAHKDGIDLYAASAYRSFSSQGQLKSSYTVQYGNGANAFSADQGYSEHQLGTTLDFTTKKSGGSFLGFEATPAYDWLTKNAYRYGFVLSYPKNNDYYVYEPWHWRYVGVPLSSRLQADKEYFYDLTQRDIDTYLISIFD